MKLEHKAPAEGLRARFGIEILSAEAGRSLLRLRLREEDRNLFGLPFGGILFNLADCAAGVALNSLGLRCVTASAAASFLRASGEAASLLCRAEVTRQGRSLSFAEAQVEDESGLVLARFQFSFAVHRGEETDHENTVAGS